ncbi:MAG TPA: DinB family protein [Candidatus Saccharimonadales bacterium]|nr:DinB family protein [Candidatus Saccharimonadales bacterium]
MTATLTVARPTPDEYFEYYGKYIALVPDEDALVPLRDQLEDTLSLLRPLDEKRSKHRYAPDKWSVKEVLGHLSDCERIFAYRALRIGRGDTTPIEGFDENAYIPPAHFDARPLDDLIEDYERVRDATLSLFAGLDEEALLRRGTANDKTISVRAIGWIIAGHELHHRGILIERYGLGK